MIFGIDVSSYQTARVDWTKVAAAGNRFAIVKVSEGDTVLDPDRIIDLEGAKAAGLYTGVYHFAHPELGDGLEQAEKLWNACGDTMPDLPPALDLESRGTTSDDAVLKFVRDFIDGCKQTFGRAPILYTGAWFWNALDAANATDISDECPLWIAEYDRSGLWTPAPDNHPSILKPWGAAWSFWQFSGSSLVDGVPGRCDRDAFNGDEDALRAFCGFPAPTAA